MISYFFDTSALIKLYVEEEGTYEAIALANTTDCDQLVILDPAILESRSAIRRREREGDIPESEAVTLLARISQDAESMYLVQPASKVIGEASRLIDSHPMRTLDALQLAGYPTVKHRIPLPLAFVSADKGLCVSTGIEGIQRHQSCRNLLGSRTLSDTLSFFKE